MFQGTSYSNIFFIICMIALSVIVFFCLIRAILGPRFTDRIVAANMVSTKVIAFICLLSVFLREDFLIDVGIIYAMLGFVGVVVLSKIIQVREKAAKLKHEREMEPGTVEIVDKSDEEAKN